MRTPSTLTIPAAVFGVVVPLAFAGFGAQTERPGLASLFCIVSWAVMPVVAAKIAYKQGFDRGFSAGRKTESPERHERRSVRPLS